MLLWVHVWNRNQKILYFSLEVGLDQGVGKPLIDFPVFDLELNQLSKILICVRWQELSIRSEISEDIVECLRVSIQEDLIALYHLDLVHIVE